MTDHPVYAKIDGPIVMIGFGSIGKGTWPLIERHFDYDPAQFVVIEPNPANHDFLRENGLRFVETPLTPETYRDVLGGLLEPGRGFCVNLSVDTSSLDLMKFCREIGVPYIDTVVEPWAGYYFGTEDNAARTNYALRQAVRDEKAANPGGTTAVSCCGANPGMVSWFVKEALLTLARDTGREVVPPQDRDGWARLMQSLGVKGVHIAERDTQARRKPRPRNVFVNTWSVEGFIAEGFQPAELGWGTHETWFPENGHRQETGCKSAIWLERPGAITRVHTWCPTPGPQFGFLVTHNEAVSISDYYTVGEGDHPEFRPTCHYAYHPCDDAVLSLHEMFGAGRQQEVHEILEVDEIVEGIDELGVLLFGHEKNALWYGSRLSNDETKLLAPYQNATGLQVTSAVLAGMVWALENPNAGIVETDEMDHARCLEVQRPYLGPVEAHYTDWTPLQDRWEHFPEDIDESDPWLFRNVLAS
ncbi:homospermidine synthase [Ponticoccus sp. SC2-23]|uniref:homospermidine synthase n=1 Tax=Alexandriicola marinus TaxID=2081710 RepID=UPI000FD80926|nr:saccharopine dehydrogenase C-terminal domain-containing protein [Alexandriicola marinus]MBM1220097.1 homospermidine synthase [Ponticoccus sp. SC6-9]MBM1224783.1 homospermidine synthase [Ponticoccus sp. SC6-15]MBM1228296.1 homospermidine synthase [Ponticoccus sp. SC6-38]MBM1234066.1 homospermidine synthase [Ponticoccus sp. SC6-45]MBM1238798.1 homospermidine synthase [Ponticoccus sp. SC6-49]MBM1242579.1 homospermidine synthase [Ponticoccus sp. SC2-64]MBM1247590.1 homospermidine synthase [Po